MIRTPLGAIVGATILAFSVFGIIFSIAFIFSN